jgi:antitoxin component YwqK of YwqJK toxin-antitoxin module
MKSWSLTFIKPEEYVFRLNDYLILFVYFLQAITTSLFSYFIWKTSVKSNEISEQLKEREDNKDNADIKENALIVYYDLLLGLNDLKKLHDKYILKKKASAPKRLYFSNEWIKNVAVLKDKLGYKDINSIYQLYGDLLTMKELLENNSSNELQEEIERSFNKIVSKNYLEYMWDGLEIESVEGILNIYYGNIFEKLKKVLFLSTNKNISENNGKYRVMYDKDKIWYEGGLVCEHLSGPGEILDEEGKIRYIGVFENDNFKEGIRYGHYNNGRVFFKTKYKDGIRIESEIWSKDGQLYFKGTYNNNDIENGIGKVYDNKGKLEYDGEIKNGKYNGKGIRYETLTHKEEGIWEEGRLIRGVEYGVLLEDSNDHNWEANFQWEQQQIEKQNDDEYLQYEFEMEEKAEKENAVGWEKYGDIEWDNGRYNIRKDSIRIRYIQDGEN